MRRIIVMGAVTLLALSASGDQPAAKPKNPEEEKQAIEYLQMRNIEVSADSLHSAAFEANFEDVRHLLMAGVPVDGEGGNDTPLVAAMTGCTREGETDLVVDVVDLLVKKGADVKRKDDNANTPLITAAQYCGARVVNRLIAAGADVDAVNGSSMTPLMIALVMGRFDAADALVANGAKLNAQQAEVMKNSVSDPRGKAIVAKAAAKPPAKKK